MNVCVYGAGAVGGSIAARLSAAGQDGSVSVSVVARGAQLEAIRERGLTVISGDKRIEARVHGVDDPAMLGPQDLVVVTVKGQQLPAIAAPLGRMVESGARVVFAMNGILWWFADGLPLRLPVAFAERLDPGGELRKRIPSDRIIGCVVNSSNEVIEPGVIVNTSPARNRLVVGAADRSSPRSFAALNDVAALFSRAGYESPVAPDIRQEVWSKLALYTGFSAVAALTHCSLDRLVADPGTYELMAGLMRETIEIGAAMGFELSTDVDSDLARFRGRPTRPSMLQDFERGREPELDGSVLAVEAIAEALGVTALRVRMVAALLRMKAAH